MNENFIVCGPDTRSTLACGGFPGKLQVWKDRDRFMVVVAILELSQEKRKLNDIGWLTRLIFLSRSMLRRLNHCSEI
jgi:hypothetical protein